MTLGVRIVSFATALPEAAPVKVGRGGEARLVAEDGDRVAFFGSA